MKKLISIYLCALILATSLMGTVLVEASGFDVNLSADNIALFEAVGILDQNDEFISNESLDVTRGEFARLLICMLGYRETAADIAPFTDTYRDVKTKTAHYSEILLATQLGLFGNPVSGYFYPEEKAQTIWAAQAVARLLGYGVKVEHSNTIISSLGLFKNLNGKSAYLRRDDALKMVYNALSVNLMQIVGVNANGMVLSSRKNETILTEYFGVEYEEDIMLADTFTAVFGKKTKPGFVRFGSTMYHADGLETQNLVGANVRYYYREDDGEKYIVHFEKRKTTEVMLSADKAEYNYAQNCYIADNSGKTLQFPMELSTMVAYNGEPCFDKALMQPKTGQITLIDNDSDGNYEVCIIREFRNLIVKSCHVAEGEIFDSLDRSRDLYTKKYDQFNLYSEKGLPVDLSALKVDSVLTVYESADKRCAEAYISAKSFSLQLEEINLSENILVIDGISYKLSADSRIATDGIRVGQYYYFYINHWNEVVYASANWNYTAFYLMETAKGKGINPSIFVKGLEESGFVEIYELADKVSWNTYEGGRETIKKEEAYNRLNSYNGAVNRQLIKMNQDASGKLKEIIIAYEANSRSDVLGMDSDYPLIHMNYIIQEWPLQLTTSGKGDTVSLTGAAGFGNWLQFSKQAIQMFVPLNETAAGYREDNVYLRRSIRTKSGDSSRAPDYFNTYSSGRDKIAADYLITEMSNALSGEPGGYFLDPYLVTNVVTGIDEESGDVIYKITMCSRNGSVQQYTAKDDTLIEREALVAESKSEKSTAPDTIPTDKKRLEPGDIVGVELDQAGKISRIRLVYDGQRQQDMHPLNSSGDATLNSTSDIIDGRVVRISDSFIECEASSDALAEGTIVTADVSNYLIEYDLRTRTARRITANELYPEDHVILYLRYASYYMAVVYRNM